MFYFFLYQAVFYQNFFKYQVSLFSQFQTVYSIKLFLNFIAIQIPYLSFFFKENVSAKFIVKFRSFSNYKIINKKSLLTKKKQQMRIFLAIKGKHWMQDSNFNYKNCIFRSLERRKKSGKTVLKDRNLIHLLQRQLVFVYLQVLQ